MALDTEETVEGLKGATTLELSDLVKVIEEEFDAIAAAPVTAVDAVAGVATRTRLNVGLTKADQKKVKVTGAVREITGLGPKGPKDLVDDAPKVTKEGVSEGGASDIKAKLEEVGTTATAK